MPFGVNRLLLYFLVTVPSWLKAAYTALVNTVFFDRPCEHRKLNATFHVKVFHNFYKKAVANRGYPMEELEI